MQNHNLLKKQIFNWSDHIPCLLSLSTKLYMRTHPHCIALRKNTAISPDFLVWKFCGKAQFPHSFGRFALNYEETAFPQNFYTRKSGEIMVSFAAGVSRISYNLPAMKILVDFTLLFSNSPAFKL